MISRRDAVLELVGRYGCPLYVFDEGAFRENYRRLLAAFRGVYENYNIAYSFKTNYTPYVARLVRRLGGFGEVVSAMEYDIALRTGYPEEKIVFNGPNKGSAGVRAFLNGCMVNADSLTELAALCQAAKDRPEGRYEVGLRLNVDVGQGFISRFGMDPEDIPRAMAMVSQVENLEVTGLHCHISRCRGLEAWIRRAEELLWAADRYLEAPPKYLDLGSGMFGAMDPELAAQFGEIPTYEQYAQAVAGLVRRHYGAEKPLLLTEPGTTLINRYVDLVARVDVLKTVRGRHVAILNCGIHNLGETCTLKELPVVTVPMGAGQGYTRVDLTGYTCLEQDVMRRDYAGPVAQGDYVVFGNVGGYSNVLKPPFIAPNCAMAALRPDGTAALMKRKETFDDILGTYSFEEDL